MTVGYNNYGELPYQVYIASVVPSYLGLRVNFNTAMTNDAALSNPRNYTITVQTPSSSSCGVISVTPEAVANPTYVDLDTSDVTHGSEYILTITPDQLTDTGGDYLGGGNTVTYSGVSLMPEISSVTTLSNALIEVQFNKAMSLSDISDVNTYSFDKGLGIISVTVISASVVRLKTTSQTPSELYTLTVN